MAWIQSPPRELPYAMGAAIKLKKKKKEARVTQIKYMVLFFFFFFFFFLVFLPFIGLLPRHMEVPRLGVELEL